MRRPKIAAHPIPAAPCGASLGYTSAQMYMIHFYDIETGWDGANVHVVTNGTPVLLSPLSSAYTTLNGTSSALPQGQGFTGGSPGYVLTVFDLSSYAGQSIRLRFNFGTDSSVTVFYGWAIDNVYVWAE